MYSYLHFFELIVAEMTQEANNNDQLGQFGENSKHAKAACAHSTLRADHAFIAPLTVAHNCKNGQQVRKLRKQRSQPVSEDSSR